MLPVLGRTHGRDAHATLGRSHGRASYFEFFLSRLSAFFSAGVLSGFFLDCFWEFCDFAMIVKGKGGREEEGGWGAKRRAYFFLFAATLDLVACWAVIRACFF